MLASLLGIPITSIFVFIFHYINSFIWEHTVYTLGDQKTTGQSWFSLSTTWVLGMDVGSLGSVAAVSRSFFPKGNILMANGANTAKCIGALETAWPIFTKLTVSNNLHLNQGLEYYWTPEVSSRTPPQETADIPLSLQFGEFAKFWSLGGITQYTPVYLASFI